MFLIIYSILFRKLVVWEYSLIVYYKFCRFKLKYHPEDSSKRKEEQKASLSSRVEVFNKFLKQGKFDKVTVDNDQSDSIVKLLDSVVILLEGGNDFDLQVKIYKSNFKTPKCRVLFF